MIPEPMLVWGPGGNTSLRVWGGWPSVCMEMLAIKGGSANTRDHCDIPKAVLWKSGCRKRSRATRGVKGLCSRWRRTFSQGVLSHQGRGCPGGRELPSLQVCEQRLGEAIHSLTWQLWRSPCWLVLREHQGCCVGQTEPVPDHRMFPEQWRHSQGAPGARTSETRPGEWPDSRFPNDLRQKHIFSFFTSKARSLQVSLAR